MASQKIAHHILMQAASWHLDLMESNLSPELSRAHQHWLEQDPLHRLAWARVEKLQGMIGTHKIEGASEIISDARQSRRKFIKLFTTLLVATGTGITYQHTQRGGVNELLAMYKTGSTDRKQLTLDDDSKVHLNIGTSIDVNYSASARELHLYRGEVFISTGKDAIERPFYVDTPSGNIQALGTEFTVRVSPDKTQVSVTEKSVEVFPKTSKDPVIISEGKRTTFDNNSCEPLRTISEEPSAWTRNMLIVRDWTLAQFLDELARYHRGHISYSDDAASLRISGAFHLHDTHAVLKNLTKTLPIILRQFTPYWSRIDNKSS